MLFVIYAIYALDTWKERHPLAGASATTRSKRADDFIVSFLILLVLPLIPLILELLIKAVFKRNSPELLEPGTIMVTASIFAASVGIASRSKGICGGALFVALLVGVLYGGKEMTDPPAAPVPTAQRSLADLAGTPSAKPDILHQLGLDDLSEIIAWVAIACMAIVLLVERLIRHAIFAEPYEFEWNKK